MCHRLTKRLMTSSAATGRRYWGKRSRCTYHNGAPEAVLDPEEVVGEAEVLREFHQQVDAESRTAAKVARISHRPADVDPVWKTGIEKSSVGSWEGDGEAELGGDLEKLREGRLHVRVRREGYDAAASPREGEVNN